MAIETRATQVNPENQHMKLYSRLTLALAFLSGLFLTAWILTVGLGSYVWIKSGQLAEKSKWRKKMLKRAAWSTFLLLMALSIGARDKDRFLPTEEFCETNMNLIFGFFHDVEIQGKTYETSHWCDLVASSRDAKLFPNMFHCAGRLWTGRHIFLIDVRLFCVYRNRDRAKGPCDYALNENISGKNRDRMFDLFATDANEHDLPPSDVVFLFESGPGWNQVGSAELLTTDQHHGKGCNILFCSGDVEFVKSEDLTKLSWTF